MKKLISVIVPIYRVEGYLNRCIESILNQTYQNLEIILVDDGSPDSCPLICDQYAKIDKRVRVIHKINGGLSDARNVGIQAAHGEYLCFVDSDDFIAPTMLEHLYDIIKKSDAKISMCNIKVIDETGIRKFECNHSPICDGVFEATELLPKFYQTLGWYYIVAWNKLYHRNLFIDIKFPVGKIHEDEFIAAHIMWKAEKIACTSREEYNYVFQRKGSIMSSNLLQSQCDWLDALYQRFCFCNDKVELVDFRKETRAVYFRELINLFQKKELRDSIDRFQRQKVLRQYQSMKGKTATEKINWILFRINPQIQYWVLKKVRIGKGDIES